MRSKRDYALDALEMAPFLATENKNGTIEEILPQPELDDDQRSSTAASMTEPLRTQLANDPELQGLSLYEKKAVLVNRELDSHGMGRYQWWIWVLCGMGYFIDLMWAQSLGLALVAIEPEYGLIEKHETGTLSTAFNAGLTIGAFTWGFLVDIIGRWWAFNGTVFIAAVFGLALGGANSYITLCVLAAFCGFGVGGNIPIDTTICLEFIPQNRRFLLVCLSLFQPLGVIVSCGIAYGLVPRYSCSVQTECGTQTAGQPCCTKDSNYGWRYYFFCLGSITFLIFLLRAVFFRFRESPKFLLYRGRDDKAAKVLEQVANFNKREPMVTLEHFNALTDDYNGGGSDPSSKGKGRAELGSGELQQNLTFGQVLKTEAKRISLLFATKMSAYMTILIWITYMFDYLSFSAAGTFIPILLKYRGQSLGVSTDETYRNYIIVYAPGLVAALVGGGVYMIPGIGRKYGMVVSSILQGVSLFLFAAARTVPAFIGFNVLEYFMQTLFNAILYGWTPEVFAAPVRGTACGLSSTFGRVFGIIAPSISAAILATYGDNTSDPQYGNGVLYFSGSVVFVATICILLMPNKKMGSQSL